MRNRPDINYLTIIGLSLTVVIAMQKGDSCEDSVKFKLSDADGHHICFLSVNAVRDAFLAVSNEKSSFVFGQNSSSFVALSSPIKVLIDGKVGGYTGITYPGPMLPVEKQTREHIPEFSSFLSPSLSLVNNIDGSVIGDNSRLIFSDSFCRFCYPVRAGPYSFI